MAMMRVESVPLRVRADWFDGRPRLVEWGEERLPVLGVSAVRHETAAYRAETGPRTLFEVDTPKARLAISFAHRSRRWTLEAVDEASPPS
ncbi:MAG TPA: hypothetical protein VNO86_08530 [Candidatus Binatia bacterium]|nr:hypothetical protein [Candidatus Binatia bacterium]